MKDKFNELMQMGGPVMQETMKALKDPQTPIREKVKLLSTLALPELRKVKSQPAVAMMLPVLVASAVAEAKGQFKALPKEDIVSDIDAQLTQLKLLDKPTLKDLLKAHINLIKAELAQKEKVADSQTVFGMEQKELTLTLADFFVELGEDKYTAVGLGIEKIRPAQFSRFFENPENDPNFDQEQVIRQGYRKIVNEGVLVSQSKEGPLDHLIQSEAFFDYFFETLSRTDGEKLYAMAEKIADNLDEQSLVDLAENALTLAEDMLVAGKAGGNPFMVKNGAAAEGVANALRTQTQLIEDAVLESGILPEDSSALRAAYEQAHQKVQADKVRIPLSAAAPQKGSGPKSGPK